jgi:hypothetical protein
MVPPGGDRRRALARDLPVLEDQGIRDLGFDAYVLAVHHWEVL